MNNEDSSALRARSPPVGGAGALTLCRIRAPLPAALPAARQLSWAGAERAESAPDRRFSLLSARIFTSIPRPLILLPAASAIAFVSAVPGPEKAATIPAAAQLTPAYRAAVLPHRTSQAALAISAIPATSPAVHYQLTAYTLRHSYRARWERHRYRARWERRGYWVRWERRGGWASWERHGYRARREPAGYGTPRRIAWSMVVQQWPSWQFRFLDRLWEHESSWNPQAANPYSGAYGIPQAVPASKMAAAGPDWRWSARTQIRWGLGYISARYGSPYGAWQHEECYGWY
jgi:hypothetical protein